MPEIKTIDLSQDLNKIKKKYGERFFVKPEAFAEAAELWGFSEFNDCGVVPSNEEIIVDASPCKASVRITESTKGYWLMSYTAETSISGVGSCPNVFNSIGFRSREDAITAGTCQIKKFYQSELSQKGSHRSAQQIKVEQALKLIEQNQNQPELNLF